MKFPEKKPPSLSRRLFLFFSGAFLLGYPLVRFFSHHVPKKPKIIEIHEPLQTDGHLARKDFFIFSDEKDIWGVSRTCTHLGCHLNYKQQEQILECPCHQSRFSLKGKVIHGPAEKHLAVFKVERQDNPPTLIITM